MKKNAILGSIISILVVGSIYVFAFCFIRKIDNVQVSDELIYNNQSSGDSNLSSESVNSSEIIVITEDRHTITTAPQTEDPQEIETTSDLHKEFDNENKEQTDIENDEDLYDDNNTQYQTAKATNVNAFAENDNKKVTTLEKEELIVDDEPVTTTAPVKETTVTTTVTTVQEYTTTAKVETTAITSFVPDVIIQGDNISNDDTQTTTTSPTVSTPLNDVLSVRINGSVQSLDGYTLVCKIVANEISTSFSDEAIKAQAVATYSYIKYNNSKGISPSVLVDNNVPTRIKNIVSQVYGIACYYNGSYAQTVYCASTAGYSASAVNVWGTNIPYLVSVPCAVDLTSDPNYGLTKTFSEADIRSRLESKLGIVLSNNPSEWIKIMSYIDTSYVGNISIDGQKTISGRYLRETVLSFDLRSASFDVAYNNGQFVFTTYGYGHGVGMSQNGANILAKQGYTYTDILKYYYTGITVQ